MALRVFSCHHPQRLADRCAVAFGLDQSRCHRLDPGNARALAEVFEGLSALLQIGELGGGEAQLLGKLQRLAANLGGDFAKAGFDRPDCTQIKSISSASGKEFLIEVRRRCTRFSMNMLGR